MSHSYSQWYFPREASDIEFGTHEFPEGERGGILTLPSVMAIVPMPFIQRLLFAVSVSSRGWLVSLLERHLPGPKPLFLPTPWKWNPRTENERKRLQLTPSVRSVTGPSIPLVLRLSTRCPGKFQAEDNGLPVDARNSGSLGRRNPGVHRWDSPGYAIGFQ